MNIRRINEEYNQIFNEISDELVDKVNTKRHEITKELGKQAIDAFVQDKDFDDVTQKLWDAGKKAKKNDELYQRRRFRKEFPDGTMTREQGLALQKQDAEERKAGAVIQKPVQEAHLQETVRRDIYRVLADIGEKFYMDTKKDIRKKDLTDRAVKELNARNIPFTPEELAFEVNLWYQK